MDLHIDYDIAEGYTSNVQKARVITEAWMHKNMYCPVCGRAHLAQFPANKPVADFYCDSCKQEFELKSKLLHRNAHHRCVGEGGVNSIHKENIRERTDIPTG
jgi:transposase-like protein